MLLVNQDESTSFQCWFNTFLPVVNFNRFAQTKRKLHFGFAAQGSDLAHVQGVAAESPNHVWTLIKDENDSTLLAPGYQELKRLSHLITEKPWEKETQPLRCLTDEFAVCNFCESSGLATDLVMLFTLEATSIELCLSCGGAEKKTVLK